MQNIIHAFFAALLIYVAWLQVNDPDPLFWVSLYLISAAIPLTAILKPARVISPYIHGLAFGFCLAGIAMVFSGASGYIVHMGDESLIQDMSPNKPYIEEARELIGTFMALIVVFVYAYIDYKKNR